MDDLTICHHQGDQSSQVNTVEVEVHRQDDSTSGAHPRRQMFNPAMESRGDRIQSDIPYIDEDDLDEDTRRLPTSAVDPTRSGHSTTLRQAESYRHADDWENEVRNELRHRHHKSSEGVVDQADRGDSRSELIVGEFLPVKRTDSRLEDRQFSHTGAQRVSSLKRLVVLKVLNRYLS